MPATATPPIVTPKLVSLVFQVPADGLHVQDMSDVLDSVNKCLVHLDPNVIGNDLWGRTSKSGVFVVSTSLNSPWTLLLAFVNLPERVYRGFKALTLNLVFYEEEKQRRAGLAAQELAKAHEMHLSNVQKTIAIAREIDPSAVSLHEVKALYEATSPLHRSSVKLIRATEQD